MSIIAMARPNGEGRSKASKKSATFAMLIMCDGDGNLGDDARHELLAK